MVAVSPDIGGQKTLLSRLKNSLTGFCPVMNTQKAKDEYPSHNEDMSLLLG